MMPGELLAPGSFATIRVVRGRMSHYIEFEFLEDRLFFETLFREVGPLDSWAHLFDFTHQDQKRAVFNKLRNQAFSKLMDRPEPICHLAYPEICTVIPEAIDHIIPLSSNILNKRRGAEAKPGKKVKTQSIGSNHPHNFALACARCNNHKKHRFLEPEHLARVIFISEKNQ